MRPWPWTIDADGVGQFFATKAQAVTAVAALQAQGVRSIDVGCMQVNLMHHPDAFASLDQAFDPAANTGFAVRFLDALYRRTGTWPRSIATYHSETPQIAEEYQRRVMVTGTSMCRRPRVAAVAGWCMSIVVSSMAHSVRPVGFTVLLAGTVSGCAANWRPIGMDR